MSSVAPAPAGEPGPVPTRAASIEDWTRTARIAGAAVWVGMTDAEVDRLMARMEAQNVSVIEADSDLSRYLTDEQFDEELALMRTLAAAAHDRGLRIVWYYPTLEVLTPDAATAAHTMYKDHPDWVQVGLNGEPNVFIGGEGRAFWVDPGMESAWMSVATPYRDYFLDRVKRIAATGVDGLWADVPLLNDLGVEWSDFNPAARAKFTAATGLQPPVAEDWSDPVWRRWIVWRHEEIRDFLRDVRDAGRSIDPRFTLIVETVTMDYNAATRLALDGADLARLDGVTQVWELDALSDKTGMRRARPDDWVSLIAMNKYARAASGDKPAWIFTYGKRADDAALVMAESLAAGNNPYETKIPEMATTVGAAYRTRMFGFVREHAPLLFGTRTAARVAVLHSGPSRDHVDRAAGLGLYATTAAGGDALWWSTDPNDSAYRRQYLAEYRGMVKLLVHAHIPFDVVVRPDLNKLAPYQVVILPDVEAIPDDEAAVLRTFVQAGGNLVVTGPDPTGLDAHGTARADYALADLLGFHKPAVPPAQAENVPGAGSTLYFSALLGKSYFTSDDAAARTTLLEALARTSTSPLVAVADPRVHLELSRTDDQLVLQLVNAIGVSGAFSVVPTTVRATLTLPVGTLAAGVAHASPDLATDALSPLAFTTEGSAVSFDVPVSIYSLVAVTLTRSPPGENRPPVAAADVRATAQDTSWSFGAGDLLANDSDPDGDLLVVLSVDAASLRGGAIASTGAGSWRYTPPAGFCGPDSFGYRIGDGRGGEAEGTVALSIGPANRPPVAAPEGHRMAQDGAWSFTAGELLANDADPDGDPLAVLSVDDASLRGGTVDGTGAGSWRYTPPAGFSGPDSFGYRIGDGRGGEAEATVAIEVTPPPLPMQPVDCYPMAVQVTAGRYDWGTLASFAALDASTYDVRAAAAAGGQVAEWTASTILAGPRAGVTSIAVTYAGQYSRAAVSQTFALFNFQTSSWDVYDSRSVGNTDDVTVTVTVAAPERYISAGGEMRVRVRGTKAAGGFFCWANLLRWSVK